MALRNARRAKVGAKCTIKMTQEEEDFKEQCRSQSKHNSDTCTRLPSTPVHALHSSHASASATSTRISQNLPESPDIRWLGVVTVCGAECGVAVCW